MKYGIFRVMFDWNEGTDFDTKIRFESKEKAENIAAIMTRLKTFGDIYIVKEL